VDQGPVEALRTTGARRLQLLQHAVLPTVAPTLVSLTLYRLDVHVRDALTLGVVGSGGLGFLIDQSINEFAFKKMATEVIVMLIVIVAVDQLSTYIQKRLAE
jgi:phosphonate transport system permease protein